MNIFSLSIHMSCGKTSYSWETNVLSFCYNRLCIVLGSVTCGRFYLFNLQSFTLGLYGLPQWSRNIKKNVCFWIIIFLLLLYFHIHTSSVTTEFCHMVIYRMPKELKKIYQILYKQKTYVFKYKIIYNYYLYVYYFQ